MTQLVGILNITPDSFSDGGQFAAPDAALAQLQQLLDDGADMVDIGAESTRPGATLLSAEEEWARLAPALSQFPFGARISVDTRHASTARQALDMGVYAINDVGSLRAAALREVLAQSDCPIVVMHALSLPADPAIVWAEDIDPIAEILRWKDEVLALAAQNGIAASRLIFDPGLGFGKTAQQSWVLVERARALVASGGAWYYGHSRKSFLGVAPAARDEATLAVSRRLMAAGVQYLRVHNLKGHR